jgi:hypothetical protein
MTSLWSIQKSQLPMSICLRLTTYTTITKELLYQKYVTYASQAIYKRYPKDRGLRSPTYYDIHCGLQS